MPLVMLSRKHVREQSRRTTPPSLRWFYALFARMGILFLGIVTLTGGISAQSTDSTAPAQTLSLEDAIAIARRNNPDFLQERNNRRLASAALQAAIGTFLPQANASFSAQYQQAGQQFFSGVPLGATSDVLQSQYDVSLTYEFNPANLVVPKVRRANVAAADAATESASQNLAANVTQQYLSVLQDMARTGLQDTLVANAQLQVALTKAKAEAGTGTRLDLDRAQISLTQQQVSQVQAQYQLELDRVRLFQLIGIPKPINVALTSTFSIITLLPLDTLMVLARDQNPGITSLRSKEYASGLSVWQERLAYAPTLTLSTGAGGYTYSYKNPDLLVTQAIYQSDQARSSCIATQEVRAAVGLPNTLVGCGSLSLTDAQAASLRKENARFPFRFTRAPFGMSARLSLPLFDGFIRKQRLEVALVERDNARFATRSKELALGAAVTSAYVTLLTAQKTLGLQQQNTARAREELSLTQNQYALGLVTFVDLTTSRAAYAQAESDRINALYGYHKAVSVLENAVGRPIRER